MASYKQPCVHCGTFIERDARLCPNCASRSPFGYHCPACLRDVDKSDRVCAGCGRSLFTVCPTCNRQTFVGERCDSCKAGLMIYCTNTRCGALQFYENIKCTVCGKKIKKEMGV